MLDRSCFLASACLLVGGCLGDSGGEPGLGADSGTRSPDARPGSDGAEHCASEGRPFAVTVSGTAFDFVTGEPYPDVFEIRYGAWHLTEPVVCFQDGTIAAGDGTFSASALALGGSSFDPPILVLSPGAGGLAPMLSDRTLTCTGDECGVSDFRMPVLSRDTEQAWREELAAGGMTDAATRGLVVFRCREADGSPADGVAPRVFSLAEDGERRLEPGTEVRFLAEDREALLAADAEVTGSAGLAILAVPDELALVSGERGAKSWEGVGVIAVPGTLFTESAGPAGSAFAPTPKLAPGWRARAASASR